MSEGDDTEQPDGGPHDSTSRGTLEGQHSADQDTDSTSDSDNTSETESSTTTVSAESDQDQSNDSGDTEEINNDQSAGSQSGGEDQAGVSKSGQQSTQTAKSEPENTTSESATNDRIPEVEGITLLEGEEVMYNVRPSWSNWITQLVLIAIVTVFTLGFGAVLFVIPWLSRRKTRYVVTTERVMQRSGILGTSTNEYRIEDIRQLQTGASWVEKVLGKGNIQFSTGAGGRMITFSGVPNYDGIANTIRNHQRNN